MHVLSMLLLLHLSRRGNENDHRLVKTKVDTCFIFSVSIQLFQHKKKNVITHTPSVRISAPVRESVLSLNWFPMLKAGVLIWAY